MGKSEERGAYWAVIPANVRYDPDLKPNAKLLYGEMTSLCNQTGYCWATNDYFAELYGLSVGTISRLVSQLEQKGYIRCEMAATERGSERRVYAGIFVVKQGGIDEKRKTPIDENAEGGHAEKRKGGLAENGKHNNKTVNSKELIPPKAPQGGRSAPSGKGKNRAPKSVPDWKPERFERFWDFYPRGEDRVGAVREWDKLRPDDALIDRMALSLARQKATEDWQAGIGIPYACRWLKNRRWEDGGLKPRAVAAGEEPRIEPHLGWD